MNRPRQSSRKNRPRWPIAAALVVLAGTGVYLAGRVMVEMWGVRGLVWRVGAVVGAGLGLVLGWKYRRPLAAAAWAGLKALFRALRDRLAGKARDELSPSLAFALNQIVVRCTDPAGNVFVPVGRLVEWLQLEPRDRLTPTQSERIVRRLEQGGWGVEPDACLTGRTYRGDDTVVLFRLLAGDRTAAEVHKVASSFVRLGVVIAQADGKVEPAELDDISRQVEGLFQLNPPEKSRMNAWARLLASQGADLVGLGRWAATLTAFQRQAMAKILLVIVASDGVVTKEEIAAVRKCYKTLGLGKEEVDQAIASLRAMGQAQAAPPAPRAATAVAPEPAGPAAAAEPLAAPPEEEVEFRLDHAAIQTILADTRQVAAMLAEAMKVDEPPASAAPAPAGVAASAAPVPVSDVPAPPAVSQPVPAAVFSPAAFAPAAPAAGPASLPQRYAAFYQLLISRDRWLIKELDTLARGQGLMLSGAIDALNEWAAQELGGMLFVEEEGQLLIERAYLPRA